jgi:hypothetical protein
MKKLLSGELSAISDQHSAKRGEHFMYLLAVSAQRTSPKDFPF